MTLMKWKPEAPARSLSNFNSLLENFFDDFNLMRGSDFLSSMPSVNIREDNDNYYVDVAAPGLTKEDFNVSLDNHVLTISAEKEEEHKDQGDQEKAGGQQYTRREFNYTSFQRSFNLPDTVDEDKIGAEYKEGVLNLTMPKKDEAKPKPQKSIEIK